MKIGFVIDDSLDSADGVQQYVLTLGKWLEKNGHEVVYLAGQTVRTDIENIYSLSRNIRVRFNQNRMAIPLPASTSRIKHILTEQDFDILHVQMPYSPFLAGKIIKNASKKTAIIGTFHVLPFSGAEILGSKILRYFLNSTLQSFDKIISVSTVAQTFAYQTYGIKSVVIPNVVNINNFTSGKKLKMYNDNIKTIVYLGRFVKRKGTMQLLKAVSLLNKTYSLSFRLVLCGKGPEEDKLRSYVIKNNLQDIVEFVGFVSEESKANYLASADVAVFPSIGGESFGIVLIEAMASGAGVVVGGNNPGYNTVLDGNANLLFSPNDAAEFANLLNTVLTNSTLSKALHKWLQERVLQYDVEVVGRDIVQLYQEALRKRITV